MTPNPIVVLDTNKIIAAILRPGRVRRNLLSQPCTFITPPRAWEEVEEHITEIARKKGVPAEILARIMADIREETTIEAPPTEPYATVARRLAGDFDPDDWPFIALALQHGAPIWTNDQEIIKHSLHRGIYKAVDTTGLEMLLQGKPWGQIIEYLKRKYAEIPRK